MPNRLIDEASPYLRQHADNLVDWYPWGEEALTRARAENRPILLSIGYAACHWCHVMAHESFEDAATAALMNRHFVNVKVDREERPDLDGIYMEAVVRMTGHGGWPMTVALTPDGEPFFGGTYFPPVPRHGSPSFTQVLEALAEAWATRQAEVREGAGQLAAQLGHGASSANRGGRFTAEVLERAERGLGEQFDGQQGGFGGAPKFPHPMALDFLLRYRLETGDAMARRMVEQTLARMAMGGIYDQLGGGFARYATDAAWLVPHFEKMLYDNALLARLYADAWKVFAAPMYRRVAEETLDWALRELGHADGGFFASLDADSEGEEGRFYAWTAEAIRTLLGDDAELFALRYGVTETGNWEGQNVLHLAQPVEAVAEALGLDVTTAAARLEAARRTLAEARERRARPGRDEKVLAGWNGLMIAALAEAGRVFGRPDYIAAAARAADFAHRALRGDDGRLWRSWTPGGGARLNAYLEDHACLAEGLIALYRATFDARWLAWARELAGTMTARFADADGGGFFDTSDDHETLIYRPKDTQDNAVPSGNAMAATVLLQLALYTDDPDLWDRAEGMLAGASDQMGQHPLAFGQWLAAASLALGRPRTLAIVGGKDAADTAALLAAADAAWRPDLAVAVGGPGEATTVPVLAGRATADGRACAWLCDAFTACHAPTSDPAVLAAALDAG